MICRLFLKKNDEVIVSQFSFIIYRMYSIMNSAKVKYAKDLSDHIPLKEVISFCDCTDLVNSNNKIVIAKYLGLYIEIYFFMSIIYF